MSAHKANGRVTVTWQTPQSDGGLPITGYEVIPYIGDQAQPLRRFEPLIRKGIMNGLTSRAQYTFKVAAINALGAGVLSSPSPAVDN